jgi:hypothetical protein
LLSFIAKAYAGTADMSHRRCNSNPTAMTILTFATRVASIAALTSAVGAQQPAKSGFTVKKGNDTVAVELYTRDGSSLTGEIYQSNGLRTQYTATLATDGSIKYIEMSRQGRQGQGMTLTIGFGDTLVAAAMSTSGGENEKMEFPGRGHRTPFLAVSFALCEQIVRASHLDVGKSDRWTAFRLAAADTTALTVTRFHADSVLFAMADVQLKVAISPAGDVIGGRHLGQDWAIERLK